MKSLKKISLFLVLIFCLFLFSGCGDPIDCSTQDTTYLKYKLDTQNDVCVIAKEIPKNKCGNEVAEDGETFCNCPKDVLKTHAEFGCSGNKGEYLEKSCDEFSKTCVLAQNDKVIEETKSLEFKNSDLVFSTRAVYNTPFILHTAKENKMKFEISLLKFGSTTKNYKNIIIKELRIEDSKANILATVDYNEQVSNLGDTLRIKEIGLADTNIYDFKNTIKLKLLVSYNVEYLDSNGYVTKTEPKVETLTTSLSQFRILNPNFYSGK